MFLCQYSLLYFSHTVCTTTALYEAALSYGHILATKTICLISGAAGCGKTGVKCLIYGREPPQHHEIEALVDSIFRPTSVISMDIAEDRWLHLDETELLKILEEVMSGNADSQDLNDASSPDSDGRTVSPLLPHSAEASFVTKDIMKRMTPSGNSNKELFCVNQVYIIDSGGQAAFHKLLSLFFNNIHVSISVVDLSLRLSERPIDKITRDGMQNDAAIKSALTQEEILQHNIRAFQAQIHSYEPTNNRGVTAEVGSVKELTLEDEDGNKLPLLIVVGTHKDLEHKEETVCDKNEMIHGLVKEFESHLITCGSGELIFAVNAKDPTQSDKDTINGVKQKIVTVAKSLPMEKVPIKWYVLELLLRQKPSAILSFEQCQREARELGMKTDDELHAALDYLMKRNSLFFYDCLQSLVFCSPQPLLDKLTELVEMSFELRDSAAACSNSERNFLKGLVTYDFLARKRFCKHYVSDGCVTFTPKEFIKLMAYKHVVAQVSANEYFMPFILPKLEAKNFHEYVKHSRHIAPVAIRFPGGVAPTGVFCCLVASLLSPSKSSGNQPSKWKLKDRCHSFRNCIKLVQKFQDILPISLTLIDSFTHFEAHVDIKGVADYDNITVRKLCSAVKDDIQKHLGEVCSHRNLSHELGILCMPEPCQGSSVVGPHFAHLENTGKKTIYNCEGVICKEWLVTERERCWELPYKGLSKLSMLDAVPGL